jgi:DNA-binding CsgD family transcriptional regulator
VIESGMVRETASAGASPIRLWAETSPRDDRDHPGEATIAALRAADEGDDPPQPVTRPGSATPFVGRSRDVAHIEAILAKRHDRGVMVAGAAGVGRTRLAREIGIRVAAAARNGHRAQLRPTVWSGVSGAVFLAASRAETQAAARTGRLRLQDGGRGGTHPLLIVDDAHLLSAESLAQILSQARKGRTPLLMTISSDHGSRHDYRALCADAGLQRITLGALEQAEIQRLARGLFDGQLDAASASRLARLAEGNPRALVDLVEALTEQRAFVRTGGLWTLPTRIRIPEWLHRSVDIDALAAGPRRALELIALAGAMPLAVLERVAHPEDLVELERLGLLEVRDVRSLAYTLEARVGRPVAAELAMGQLPSLRRRALLRELVDGFGPRPPGYERRVLRWRIELDAAVEVSDLLDAVRQACRAGDQHDAVLLAQVAWQRARSVDTATTYASVLHSVGRHGAAVRVLDEAERECGGHSALVVTRALGDVLQARLNRTDTAVASQATPGAVLCQAVDAYYCGDVARSYELCLPLVDGGDSGLRSAAGAFAVSALSRMGRPLTALGLARRLPDRGSPDDGSSDFPAALTGLSLTEATAMAAAEAGDLALAYRTLIDQARHPDAGHQLLPDAQRQIALAAVLLELGRPRDAWSVASAAVNRSGAWEIILRAARAEALLAGVLLPNHAEPADLAALNGNVAASRDMLRGLLARAWLTRRQASDREVAATLTGAAASALAAGAYGDVALVVHHMGRLAVAHAAGPWWDVPVEGPLLTARLDYTRALATGDHTRLTAAAEAFEAAGAALYAAEAFCELSRLDGRNGRSRAATRSAQRARSMSETCQGAVTPALLFSTDARPLSRREREIATLAVSGLSDRAIAEELCLSVRTVQNHMYRVYQKLGISDRRELAGSHGLGVPLKLRIGA